jgi:hypothetical protein
VVEKLREASSPGGPAEAAGDGVPIAGDGEVAVNAKMAS